MKKRKMQMVVNFVSFEEAEHNDNVYYSKLSAEELLKECFDLRRLNYFNGRKNNLPRIEKVGDIIKRQDYEKQNA
jgi:hypothetical protein